ncbi:MAG: imidazolonepropionase [Lysobacterales bacterium]
MTEAILPADHLLSDCRLANPEPTGSGYRICDDAAVAIHGSRIVYAGPRARLPALAEGVRVHRLDGRLLTPGLIDCHTHLVFAGNRAGEFEQRQNGASYAEIAAAGGGIRATVEATRAASADQLLAGALDRAEALLADGVTAIEIKSGYGLDLASERKLLQVARRVGQLLGIEVQVTYLALHALPAEYADRRAAYLDAVINEWLPTLHGERLIDAVDGFGADIAFGREEIRRLFAAATALGLPLKLHADQLSDQGGAALLAEFAGRSADHIEYTAPDVCAQLAAAGSVAVLLPGAFYCLRENTRPPIAALRAAGVAMAIATDCNPGTSPLLSLRLAMNQACTLFGLTPAEAFAGVTLHAARALGWQERKGQIVAGFDADLAIWNLNNPAELSYWIGGRGPESLFVGGQPRVFA